MPCFHREVRWCSDASHVDLALISEGQVVSQIHNTMLIGQSIAHAEMPHVKQLVDKVNLKTKKAAKEEVVAKEAK